MKFCKDCIHGEIVDLYRRRAIFHVDCRKSWISFGPDYTGEGDDARGAYQNAQEVRSDPTKCGPEGKWFEPKPPEPPRRTLWQRLRGTVNG